MTRSQCIEAVAKQLCLHQGLIFVRLEPKRRGEMFTYAENLVRTVERMQKEYKWREQS